MLRVLQSPNHSLFWLSDENLPKSEWNEKEKRNDFSFTWNIIQLWQIDTNILKLHCLGQTVVMVLLQIRSNHNVQLKTPQNSVQYSYICFCESLLLCRDNIRRKLAQTGPVSSTLSLHNFELVCKIFKSFPQYRFLRLWVLVACFSSTCRRTWHTKEKGSVLKTIHL